MVRISVEQALRKAASYIKRGDLAEAHKLLSTLSNAFPDNKKVQKKLSGLNKIKERSDVRNPPRDEMLKLDGFFSAGLYRKVLEYSEILLKTYSNSAYLWNLFGICSALSGRFEQATDCFTKAISLAPDLPEPYKNLGAALHDQGRHQDALNILNTAIKLKPNFAEAYNNLGNALKALRNLDEAVAAYSKALQLKPDYVEASFNMGIVLNEIGQSVESIKFYQKAIALKPDHAEAHKNLAYTLLNFGKIEEGLKEYEWRWKCKDFIGAYRDFSMPEWDGEKSLREKKILIWHEQGVGDTLNWSAYIPILKQMSGCCVLECQDKLIPILQRSFPDIEVRSSSAIDQNNYQGFDFHIPMGSLSRHLISFLPEIKNTPKYLYPDPDRVKFWSQRLKAIGNGPYIGVSWKSANASFHRRPNYAPLSEWAPIFNLKNVTFINLQYIDFKQDIALIKDLFGVDVHNFEDLDHYDDIADVAALCSALDCVVSTKVTVPLISSAVGTPTKLANWRQSVWNNVLLNPLNNSAEIFECDSWTPWGPVFQSIADDLTKLSASRATMECT